MADPNHTKSCRLPDFLIIGAMKCGTTTLYRDLLTNPTVYFPIDKEPDRLTSDEVLSVAGRQSYLDLFAAASAEQVCCEASTSSSKLPQFPGVPQRARELLGPDLKLVYLVREPISRAISHHHHSLSAGKMPGKFEDALASHPELVDWGKYAMQARAWLEFYPAEQLKIIPFEEYVADRKKTVAEISQFLGIPSEVELIEEEKAFNNSKTDTRLATGRWHKVTNHPFYTDWIRPWLPLGVKDRLRDALLPPLPSKPAAPGPDTIQRILERVRDDAAELQVLLGRKQPVWDFDRVVERVGKS